MKNATQSVGAICALLATTTISQAGIVFTSGQVLEIARPSSVRQGALESNSHSFVFAESFDQLLEGSLWADITLAGTYDASTPLTPAALAPEGAINSYFVHQDQVGYNRGHVMDSSFTITFEEEILGLIVLGARTNGPSGTTLDDSDFLGEGNGVLYPKQGDRLYRGTLDTNGLDVITLSEDRRSITVSWRSSDAFIEQMRIVTASQVPAPGVLALLGVVAGLGGGRRRRAF